LKTFYHCKKNAVITQERNTARAMASAAARNTSYNNSSSDSSGSESSPGWNKVENHKKKKNSFATGGGRGGQQRRQIASNPPHSSVAALPIKDIKDGDPLSICIPRAFKNTNSQRVFETFRRLNFGFIDGVDVVPKTAENGEDYVRIFVHFTRWNHSNPDARKFREQIVKGEQVNILYDQPKPWFWKCSLSRLSRLLPREPVEAAAVPAPVPAMSPMSFPCLPRWGTAEYMSMFSIVDTINK
jgi:hypothetical protein